MKADGKSEATIDGYVLAAKQYTSYFEDIQNINQINQADTNKMFIKYDPRKSSLNLKKVAVRQFLNFLRQQYGLKKEIVIKVKSLPRKEPEYLNLQEQQRLLQFSKGGGEFSQANLMCHLLIYCGFRVGNLIDLKFGDINPNGITLREVKHSTTRRKRVKKDILDLLNRYRKARMKYPLNKYPCGDNDYIFGTIYRGRYKKYTRQAIRKLIMKICRKIGITRRITTHSLRHSHAYRYLVKGGGLVGLSHSLSHRSIISTQAYAHLTDEDIQAELERL